MISTAMFGVLTTACGVLGSPTNPCYTDSQRCICDYDDGSGTGTPDGGRGTIEDLLYYLQIFSKGSICADFDDGSNTGTPDGGVTIEDLFFVLFHWECAC